MDAGSGPAMTAEIRPYRNMIYETAGRTCVPNINVAAVFVRGHDLPNRHDSSYLGYVALKLVSPAGAKATDQRRPFG